MIGPFTALRRRLVRAGADERGAAAVMVAIASVLVIAMLALVIDYGAVQVKEGRLQVAADAAALAIANDCSRAVAAACRADGPGLGLASANEPDATASAILSSAQRRVTVTTSSSVDFSLAATLGLAGTTLAREATAEWTVGSSTGGAVTGASVTPFLMEDCMVPEDFRSVKVTLRFASHTTSCRWFLSPATQAVRVSGNCNKISVSPGQWLNNQGIPLFWGGCALPTGRMVVALWDDYDFALFGSDRYRISRLVMFDPDPDRVTSTSVTGTFFPLDPTHPDIVRQPGTPVPGTARLID